MSNASEPGSSGSDPPRPQSRSAPHVTVVVPVRTVDDLLESQLRAVLAQRSTFSFDVVVSCNDPDGMGRLAMTRLVKRFGDRRLRAVWSGDLHGAAHARNVGARSSDAAVIAFCDADDEVAPGWLEALVQPVADGVAVGGHLDESRFAVPSHKGWRPPATPGGLPSFLGIAYPVSANMALRRADFDSAGGFDTSLLRCEDIALGWELQRNGVELRYAPDAVVHYRHRENLGGFVLQHYRYGRGMAQVLARHPMPGTGSSPATAASGLGMLRPNRQVPGQRTFVGVVVRRASLAAGRTVGLADERIRHHHRPRRPDRSRRRSSPRASTTTAPTPITSSPAASPRNGVA
jgi:cellulose synthase/poly-beta-1,6-N-acetylglucosamine synthase-like glycosyltransferase